MTAHLTELEIQQYVIDKTACDAKVVDHVATCSDCRLKSEVYQLMFTEIKQQPAPEFDFNLSDMVLAKLPVSQPKLNHSDSSIFILPAGAILLIGFAVVYFMDFKMTNIFSGIAVFSIYLIITIVGLLCVFLGVDMYRKYQKQICKP